MTTQKKKKASKASPKVGRNPFADKGAEAPRQDAPAQETPEQESAQPKAKASLMDHLDGALSWKLRQFSVLRFDGDAGKSRLSLLSLGLENPRWKASRTLDLGQFKSKSFAASVLSIRIHTA